MNPFTKKGVQEAKQAKAKATLKARSKAWVDQNDKENTYKPNGDNWTKPRPVPARTMWASAPAVLKKEYGEFQIMEQIEFAKAKEEATVSKEIWDSMLSNQKNTVMYNKGVWLNMTRNEREDSREKDRAWMETRVNDWNTMSAEQKINVNNYTTSWMSKTRNEREKIRAEKDARKKASKDEMNSAKSDVIVIANPFAVLED